MNKIERILVGNIYGDYGTGFAGNVFDPDGLAPTLSTMGGAIENH